MQVISGAVVVRGERRLSQSGPGGSPEAHNTDVYCGAHNTPRANWG